MQQHAQPDATPREQIEAFYRNSSNFTLPAKIYDDQPTDSRAE
jgi:hypothetical protein